MWRGSTEIWRPLKPSGCLAQRRPRARRPCRQSMAREPRANDFGSSGAKLGFDCASHGRCRGFVLRGSDGRTCRRTGRALAHVRHFCGCRHDRSKDGVFVFRDPKINADLSLVYEKVKIVRGMEGYGWFANTIFHDKDNDKKQYAIDFWLIRRPASSRSST